MNDRAEIQRPGGAYQRSAFGAETVLASAKPGGGSPVRRSEPKPSAIVVEPFHEDLTQTVTYLVYDERTRVGVVIDPVTDFDPRTGCTSNASNELVARAIDRIGIDVHYVLDTHVHADHLSGIPFFEDRFGASSVIGANVCEVQSVARDLFGLGDDLPTDGRQFDVLVEDRATMHAGPLCIEVLHTPGHTPACVSYRIDDAVFTGDTLFAPEYGVGRCDFPGGSAETLFDSIQRLYALPDDTRVYPGHDYRSGARRLTVHSRISEQRERNVQLPANATREDFVAFRRQRDATLAMPSQMLAALQVNVRAGRLPERASNGVSYLKIPLNRFCTRAAPGRPLAVVAVGAKFD